VSFVDVNSEEISHITELVYNAEELAHFGTKNWACPAAEVDNQRTISFAKVEKTTLRQSIRGHQGGIWSGVVDPG